MNNDKNDNVVCLRCGNCCHVDVAAYVTIEDIKRWEKEGSNNILDHLRACDVEWTEDRVINRYGSNITTCLMSCVYLKWNGPEAYCQIYDTRTEVCRKYVPGSTWLCPQFKKYG